MTWTKWTLSPIILHNKVKCFLAKHVYRPEVQNKCSSSSHTRLDNKIKCPLQGLLGIAGVVY